MRVSVVGNAGSGKSTLAAALAARTGVPHVELDSLFHQADWQPTPAEEFQARVAELTQGGGWVVDGNYSLVREQVWTRADTVVFLDLPKRTVMRQILWRTFRRIAWRQQLWNGNRERWRNFFALDPQRSIIAWSWHRHTTYQLRFQAAMADPRWAHLRFVHLRSRRAVRAFLANCDVDLSAPR